MEPEQFKDLKNLDSIQNFGISTNELQIDNSKQRTVEIITEIENGLNRIQWDTCKEDSVLANQFIYWNYNQIYIF